METRKTTNTRQKKKRPAIKRCFVISTIGAAGTEERRRTDAVLSKIIRPALKIGNVKYSAKRIDDKVEVGYITQAIVDSLREADLVVADLTGLNPNVMYELGIAHAWNVPAIQLMDAEQLRDLPFDVKALTTVPYELSNKKKIDAAVVAIRKQLRSLTQGEQKDQIFDRAVRELGTRHSMDGVYIALMTAINDMYKSLQRVRRELAHRQVWENPSALQDMGRNIRTMFGIFSDKLHVFRQIVYGRIDDSTVSEEGLALIDECSELSHDAIALDIMLTEKPPTEKNAKAVLRQLDRLMRAVVCLAESVKPELTNVNKV